MCVTAVLYIYLIIFRVPKLIEAMSFNQTQSPYVASHRLIYSAQIRYEIDVTVYMDQSIAHPV